MQKAKFLKNPAVHNTWKITCNLSIDDTLFVPAHKIKMNIPTDSPFWFDFYAKTLGYRHSNYLPLETIDDLVNQFNYVGFNDLCIYPKAKDLVEYIDPSSNATKGLARIYYGHTSQNQTG